MKTAVNYRKYLWLLIGVSILIRGFLAAVLELGNDEVYYRLYALYPDWSHFDHPPMVGLVMQLFSFNLLFDSEFFLRLSSVIFGAVNLWLIFDIGKFIRSERSGFYAALLYTSSIYGFVISGIFILPDTPQMLFWLLAVRQMLHTLHYCPHQPESGIRMLTLGIILGLGMLSKYTTIFLWFGTILYVLFFNREWLRSKWLYLSLLVSFLITLPIFIWNLQNGFVSFGFQGERVNIVESALNFNYFFTELTGEIFYNNPVNFVLIVLAVITGLRGNLQINKAFYHTILLTGLPLIFSFLVFSLFRPTLPHWSAPGYTSLVLLAAVWLDQKEGMAKIRAVLPIAGALSVLAFVVVLGTLQIRFALFNIDHSTNYHDLGKYDPSLDLTGFRQTGEKFAKIVRRDQSEGVMPGNAILAGDNWFPLANYDYYAASPIGMSVYGFGSINRIHKYAWINQINGGPVLGVDAYYLTNSRDYHSPFGVFENFFESVEPADTIQILVGKKIVKRAFVFRLRNLKQMPPNPLIQQ